MTRSLALIYGGLAVANWGNEVFWPMLLLANFYAAVAGLEGKIRERG